MKRLLAIIALSLALSGPSSADDITGQTGVIDGDTVAIYGKQIRLFSVNALEAHQPRFNSLGQASRCGQQAALALSDFIGRTTVNRSSKGNDHYDRSLNDCVASDVSLSHTFIRLA